MDKHIPILITLLTIILLLIPKDSQGEEVDILTHHQFSGNIHLHTNGFGGGLRYGLHRTRDRYNIMSFDIATIKHPKEVRLPSQIFHQARPYVYGKKNSLIAMRFGYGQSHSFTRILDDNDVILQLNYTGGLTLGFLKPVYLDIIRYHPEEEQYNLKAERYDPEKHDQDIIFGGAGFAKGLGELSIIPGASFRGGLGIRWQRDNNKYRKAEAGIQLDAFPREIPIFAATDNMQVFFNLYIQYALGTKW